MKEFLEKLIARKAAEAEELREKIKSSDKLDEVRNLAAQLEAVMVEKREAEERLAALETGNEPQLNPVATYGVERTAPQDKEIEKRLAFANYVTRHKPIPDELRAAAITGTSDVQNVIPENLINTIIEKIEATGMILPLVTRTSYPVGQKVPVDSVKPTASWVGEGKGSDVQKKTSLGSIVFGAFKLRCEIGMTQEVTVQTLPVFETLFVRQVSEAMSKAIEAKICSDDDGASGSPKGILYNPTSSTPDKAVEIAEGTTGHLTYQTLCDAEALLPQQYENGAKWFMTKKTYMAFVAMTDANGQPIARINYGINGRADRTLLGRDVILTGDYMSSYSEEAAEEDTVFAFLFNPADYVLNTSYDLGIQTKIDWDTEDHRTKAVMSVDGACIDRNSLVKLVKKGTPEE